MSEKLSTLDYMANQHANGVMPGACKYMFSKEDWAQFKDEINALIAKATQAGQEDGVAWSVGVIDELHFNATVAEDATYKGIKNSLRDRYKAVTGVDPAPRYPVTAILAAPAQPKAETTE